MFRSVACGILAALAVHVLSLPVSAQTRAPTRMPMPRLADAGPERTSALVAVSATGFVAFTSGFDAAGRLVTVIDSTGRIVARFAKTGDGPGEFRAPLRLLFADSTLYVFQAARLAAFTLRGTLLWSRTMAPTDLALGSRFSSHRCARVCPRGSGFIIGNGVRYELYDVGANGRAGEPFGRRETGRTRTGAALEAEVSRRHGSPDGPEGSRRMIRGE